VSPVSYTYDLLPVINVLVCCGNGQSQLFRLNFCLSQIFSRPKLSYKDTKFALKISSLREISGEIEILSTYGAFHQNLLVSEFCEKFAVSAGKNHRLGNRVGQKRTCLSVNYLAMVTGRKV